MLGELDPRESGDGNAIPTSGPTHVRNLDALGEGTDYRIGLSLQLPRDRRSPPLVRHLTRYALDELGVVEDATADIELAVSEACANVLEHAGSGDAYDVTVTIRPDRCELRIVDVGRGLDHLSVGADMAGVDEVRGRGLALMHALMDRVHLVSEPESGTLVLLTKRLDFYDQTPGGELLDRNDGRPGPTP